MKSRDEFMAQIEFEGRQRNGRNSQKDVTLSVVRNGSRVNIYFRNDTMKMFDGEQVVFGIYKNRIIFEKRYDGYKITEIEHKRSTYGSISASVSDINRYKKWIGDYDLKWDEFYEFYYIEREADENV